MPSQPIPWTILADEPKQNQKIVRIMDTETTSVALFTSFPPSRSNVAVLFVSSSETIDDCDLGDEKLDFPALIVPKTVGKTLFDLLDGPKDVKVRIHISEGAYIRTYNMSSQPFHFLLIHMCVYIYVHVSCSCKRTNI